MTDGRALFRFALAGIALVTPASLFGQVRRITLDEAVNLALDNSPTIVQRQGDIRIAQAARREYIGDWLPSLSGSGSFSTNSTRRFNEASQTTISGGNATSYSAGLSASYTVFDGFRRQATGRQTSAELNSADASLVADQFDVILQTKQAYFQALAADELVRVAETQIERAQNQLEISRNKLNAGSAIRSDTLRSFVEAANAQLQMVNARTQRATAIADLGRLTGLDEGLEIVPDSTIFRLVELDTAALRDEVRTISPTVRQAEADLRVADAQIAVARAGYFPTVRASYSQSWNGSQLSVLNNTWSARLSFSLPFFDGFTRETNVVRSSATQDATVARLEDTRRQVEAQLTQYFLAIESAELRLEIAIASAEAAAEDLRVQQERYRLGAATIVEVLTSQVSLDQAEVDMVQARLDYMTSKAQIEALIGREL